MPTAGMDNPPQVQAAGEGSDSMAYVYSCDCGYVARGDTAEAFVADVEEHIARAHPDMVGKLSREDILALAEEQ
jgi:predicted small metal-binding protein